WVVPSPTRESVKTVGSDSRGFAGLPRQAHVFECNIRHIIAQAFDNRVFNQGFLAHDLLPRVASRGEYRQARTGPNHNARVSHSWRASGDADGGVRPERNG